MYLTESIKILDEEYVFETGKWAKQADGSIVLRWKNIVLMANVCSTKEAKEDIDFFPLTVDFREKFYASGQFAGGYIKREGRPSTKEILISRLIDRPLRPLFPKNFHNETQLFVTLFSTDEKQFADVHAITAASASLMVSNIPFGGPVAGVRIGRVDEKLVLFPDKTEQEKSSMNLILAGTEKAVTMIEGSASEIEEDIIYQAVKFGHEEIKKLCKTQEPLRKAVKKEMLAVPEIVEDTELEKKVSEIAYDKLVKVNKGEDKESRQENIDSVFEESMEEVKKYVDTLNLEDSELESMLKKAKEILHRLEIDIVRDQIFKDSIRADKRRLDEIRPIEIELGVLPGAHGSAVFTRGETQSLGSATLGSDKNAQTVVDVDGERKENFYLHYNFLPFSVGEVRRYLGPGRREIGHGKLAENALQAIIPQIEHFPYVIRLVSEILESNGSSSMATVCSGSLALMDAGVPIRRGVAGIAMGLIIEGEKHAILSDIAGIEDYFGDMDFKVAGTQKGITALQLDTKVQGIGDEIIQKALEQAKKGRLQILDVMNKAIDSPRKEISPMAPRIINTKIDKADIGGLIGPGGNNIRSISEKTGAEIIVKDDGSVSIYATNKDSAIKAKEIIDGQFAEAEVNKIYEGTVMKITDFGAFIEIMPGKSGLCHISKLSNERINDIESFIEIGQKVKVKLLAIDRQGRLSLSMKDAS